MNGYSIPTALQELFAVIVKDMLAKNDTECKETIAVLKKQNSELKNKIKSCKVRMGSGEIDDDVYSITMEELQDKLAKNELELSKVNKNLSNLDVAVDEITSICCKLGSLWRGAELDLCQKIQNLLFPAEFCETRFGWLSRLSRNLLWVSI